jgi:hypothetical protein
VYVLLWVPDAEIISCTTPFSTFTYPLFLTPYDHHPLSTTQMADTAASASPMPAGVTDPNYKPLPGRLGNLTVPQQHALDKLKKELQDEGIFVPERMDDATLLRYVDME